MSDKLPNWHKQSEESKALRKAPPMCWVLNPETRVTADCFIWNVKAQRFHQASVAQIKKKTKDFVFVYRFRNER